MRVWLYFDLNQVLIFIIGFLFVENLIILSFELILFVKYYISEDLIVDIFNNKPIIFVNKSVGTQSSVQLLELPEPLSKIHTGLSQNIGMFLHGFSLKCDLLTSLVIESHLVNSFLPVSGD